MARLATKRRERLGLSPTATEDECLAAEKEVAKAKAEREARIAKEEEKLKKKEQAKQLRKEKSEIKFFSEMFETVGVGTQKWAEVRLLPDSISGKKSRDGERHDMKRSKMNTHIIEAYVAGMLTKEIATRLDLFLKDLVIPGITRRNAAELAVEVGERKHLKMVLTYEHWRSAKEAGLRTEPSKTKTISEVMPRGADWVNEYKKWMSDRPHFIDLKQGREMFEGPRLENMAKVKRMGNLYSAILVLEDLEILSFFVEEPPEVVSAFSDILRDESGAWGGPRDEERMKLVRKYAEGAWEGDRIKNLVLVHSVLDEENAELLSELLEGHDLTHTLHKFGKMN